MIGNINLKNGLEMRAIKIKKDFEVINQYLIADPDEFNSLDFIVLGDLKSTIANLKAQLSSNYKYYTVLDNRSVVGFVKTYFPRDSASLTIMLDANYIGGKSLASVVIYFKKKLMSLGNSSIMLSPNDTLTTSFLEAVGVSSNIIYLSGQEVFQFIGYDYTNPQPEDWEDVTSQLHFDNFFNINYIKEAQNAGISENYDDVSPQEVFRKKNDEELENDTLDEELENDTLDEELENDTLDEESEDDMIEIDDKESNSEIELSPYGIPIGIIPKEPDLIKKMSNESIGAFGGNRSTHELTGHDTYGNPIYFVPETNATYVGTANDQGHLKVKHALSKETLVPNINDYIKEISKLPTNINYSKINPSLFDTIKNTPTFRSFKDATLDENRLSWNRKFSPNWKQNDANKTSKNSGFGGLRSNYDVLNNRNTSFQDMIKARNANHENKPNYSKNDNTKKPFSGFGSGVIRL